MENNQITTIITKIKSNFERYKTLADELQKSQIQECVELSVPVNTVYSEGALLLKHAEDYITCKDKTVHEKLKLVTCLNTFFEYNIITPLIKAKQVLILSKIDQKSKVL